MIPIDVLAAFCATALLLAFVPGPDNLFVLTQSAMHGARTGIVLTLGLSTGLAVYSAATAFGIGAVVYTSPVAFNALKVFGAIYLLYLAWQAVNARPASVGTRAPVAESTGRAYRRGIIMNLMNPKIAVFFLAFLPQFASPARGSLSTQSLMLGALFILCSLCAFFAISAAAVWLSGWLRRSDRSQILLNRVAAAVFVGLAFKLATTPR